MLYWAQGGRNMELELNASEYILLLAFRDESIRPCLLAFLDTLETAFDGLGEDFSPVP